MGTFSELWSRAPAWRWVLTATLFFTGVSWLLTIFSSSATGTANLAKYTPPQVQQPSTGAPPQIQPPSTGALQLALPSPATLPSARGSTLSAHDSNFDGQLVASMSVGNTLPPNTELHLIGVYEASDPTKGAERQKCLVFRDDIPAMMACQAKFNHRMNPITVNVPSSANPIVLVLMAYEPIQWKISASSSANIKKVIISGYHGQDIDGLDPSIPTVSYSYEASPCKMCTRQSGYFYAYDESSKEYQAALKKIASITGLTPSTFQGGYKGERFYIRPGSTSAASGDLAKLKDTYSGRSFTDNIKVANSNVPLPEGKWTVVSYYNMPTGRGLDQNLLLALTGKNLAEAYYAIRVKTPEDRSGFPANDGCKRKADYINETLTNTAFGDQLCYWVGPVADAWSQPLFAAAKTHAVGNLPDLVIASSFHQATEKVSIDTLYYALPGTSLRQALPGGNQDWESANLGKNPEAQKFADQQKQWAKIWFQLMANAR